MSDTKWAPAPWRVTDSAFDAPHSVDAIDQADGQNFELCAVWGEDDNSLETEMSLANARLIAAAPELYEALSDLVDATFGFYPFDDGGHPCVAEAIAALAKARGES